MNNLQNKVEDTKIKKIIRFKNGIKTEVNDIIVNETSFVISLQCEIIGILTCTLSNMDDLVVGYLISSGVVWERNKLINIEYISDKQKYDVTLENNNILQESEYQVIKPLGCASGDSIFIRLKRGERNLAEITINANEISGLMIEFNKTSELFKTTGGVHSAALADSQNILVFREDIGRHNAVDKVFGSLYIQKQSLDDKILLTSGRISSEIVMKSINAGVQIIVSRSAPTYKGIELAEQNNITLIGFARSNNFNIYSGFERVKS